MEKQNFDSMKMILKAQNPPLVTGDWIAWKEEEQQLGTFYHVSVKEGDIFLIDKKGSRLFFCFSTIKVNLPKRPNGDEANSGNENVNKN